MLLNKSFKRLAFSFNPKQINFLKLSKRVFSNKNIDELIKESIAKDERDFLP